MQISLPTPLRKYLFLFVSFPVLALYVHWCATAWFAYHAANPANFEGLAKAVRLQPGNAEYRYLLGRYDLLVSQSPQQALPSFLKAASLNPHRADYWFSLATAYQLLGDAVSEKLALEHAIRADPTTPTVAWDAANFYLARGDVDLSLREFSVVLKSGSYRVPDSVRLCWLAKSDAEYLIRNVLPPEPDVYFALLDYLLSIQQNVPAAQVWAHIVQLGQPLEQRHVLEYVRVLLASHDVTQAALVWQQAATLADLAAYQPSTDNLIINGDFSLDILNAGFGWHYEEVPGVELALDPTQSRNGRQSLSISYDSANLNDSGLSQQIPVQPDTTYEFSANFKAPDMQGAGGPQFLIADAWSGTQYFASDDLKDADFWKQVGGTFSTGPNTRLLTLRIQRVPAGSPIRGKLWIDGLRLRPQAHTIEKTGPSHD
jgi:hypothetical protein